jgi:hypothetical protein
MEMKRIVKFMGLILATMLQGCSGQDPTKEEMIGTWVSSDGATLRINDDGTFSGKALPAQYFSFFVNKEDVQGKTVSGEGKWRIEKKPNFWRVKLDFEEMNGIKKGADYFILISGTNGILENKPPWYLFEWVDEEGGPRYKFEKQ